MFRSHLLGLFTTCTSCNDLCAGEIAYQMGTLVAVEQRCSHCGHQRLWRSQPYIKDTPAGNILLSAAIVFSGATPGKTLRLLSHMQVACFSERTFYFHQNKYLAPAIVSVWEESQSKMLSQIRGTPLSIGGDGRADSPGHSAKYGSYGIVDLNTNKVLHIQLVQVKQN